jgi:hypothetical protein
MNFVQGRVLFDQIADALKITGPRNSAPGATGAGVPGATGGFVRQ